MGKCSYCGADINFIRMETGKWMPVEPKELSFVRDDGSVNFIISAKHTGGKVARGRLATKDDIRVWTGHIPHWDNCPSAPRSTRTETRPYTPKPWRDNAARQARREAERGTHEAPPPKKTFEQLSMEELCLIN